MRKQFIALFLMTSFLSGCATFGIFDSEMSNADRIAKEKKYGEAVVLYDKIARDASGTERGAKALLSAAKTRSLYDNPHKDYGAALQQFDEFLRKYPNNENARDAHQWRFLVRTAVELKKENEQLLKNIEQLKKVDIRHEERRKGK